MKQEASLATTKEGKISVEGLLPDLLPGSKLLSSVPLLPYLDLRACV
jgi:hypothetical protein